MSTTEKFTVTCKRCGRDNAFNQPYAYHAGFGNQGFLYDDAGTRTLIWSTFDPAYQAVVGNKHPWALTQLEQQQFESKLQDTPSGGRWRFSNPARCLHCAEPISGPISQTIYYLVYPDSVVADDSQQFRLRAHLTDAP